MKTLGIVGGIGPESTIEYYRGLVRSCRERAGADAYPAIVIDSVNVAHVLRLAHERRLDEMTGYIGASVARLHRAGAMVAIIAANTPHLVFDVVARSSPIPLVSIVAATCKVARLGGYAKLGLLGTRATMQGGFYQAAATQMGLSVVLPGDSDQQLVHDRYVGELVQGIFRPETRFEILQIIERMRGTHGIDAAILAGTELPLLLRSDSHEGTPLLDTTRLHVAAAVDAMFD